MIEIDKIYCINCIEGMKQLSDNYIDAIVTDPPYELGFMGKVWDKSGIAYRVDVWKECLRVLKPGGHLLSFGGSRTYHRMVVAVEDTGFEIRDMINWVYGSGFPKSLDISKAIDKMKGAEREVIGKSLHASGIADGNLGPQSRETDHAWTKGKSKAVHYNITEASTQDAKKWSGWGTALKPAHEPIVLARKPLSEDTVAKNVLKWGTGGLNIDECRIETTDNNKRVIKVPRFKGTHYAGGKIYDPSVNGEWKSGGSPLGRFPANLIHDGSDEVLELFPNSNGSQTTKVGKIYGKTNGRSYLQTKAHGVNINDSGSASRFFYCAKASKEERNRGCEELEEKNIDYSERKGLNNSPIRPDGSKRKPNVSKNNHPTVKPLALIEYLVKLVTKEDQLILDPFIGSGTTAIACRKINRHFIGFDINPEYVDIANNRLRNVPKRLECFG